MKYIVARQYISYRGKTAVTAEMGNDNKSKSTLIVIQCYC